MLIAEHEARFSTLVMAVVEETAAPAELAEFKALLRAYPEFKQQYLDQIRIHALMCHRSERFASVPIDAEGVEPAAKVRRPDWRGLARKTGAAAAAALFLSGVLVAINHQHAVEESRQASAAPSKQGAIEIVRQVGVSGLDVPSALPGSLRLGAGHISVRLKSGVALEVLGPADMLVTGSMDVRLRTGRLLAHVPQKARGFMVQTPELELWDMGTRFGVSVTEDMSDVFVFQGSVQVNEASGEAVDLCREGEGVRAINGELPLKFAADWEDAAKLLAAAQTAHFNGEPAKTLQNVATIADMWAERYMPRLAKDLWLSGGGSAARNRKGQLLDAGITPIKGEVAFGKKRPIAAGSVGDAPDTAVKPAVKAASTRAAAGSVPDFRNAVRREASLIHHYTFEGPQADAADMRLLDRAGAADLVERVRNTSMPQLAYDTGHDALSYAGVAVYSTNSFTAGRAWTTAGAIALPRAMTIECVVSPYAIPPLYGAGVVTSRAADNQRGYYVWLTTGGAFETRVGGGDARTILSNVSTGHWYYIVNTYDFDGAQTTVNSYCADLTAGTPLQHVIMDAVDTGDYGDSAVLGIGVLPNLNEARQYFAPCAIDEVALYAAAHDFDKI
ncbi:MAG: FecR domain-containing protein, partial [Kiritimatiellae bacterium]|nr:FecR domain-containing protein [Kiritimatiellia bacterium]